MAQSKPLSFPAKGATRQPLELSRTLHAPRATVFEAWISAKHVKRWFAPEPFTVPEATIETRVGGRFDLCMRSPQGEEHWVRGTFIEIVPDTRLVIDMTCTDAAGKALFGAYTQVRLSDALGGTRMDLVQRYAVLAAEAAWMVEGAPSGWSSALESLERQVVRMQVRAQPGAQAGARSVVHAEFHLERVYDSPVARVWQALTEPEAKAKWFAGTPGKWELLERRMDLRVGGCERLRGRWEGGVVSTFDAVYQDIVPNERLVYCYQMFLDERKLSVSLATLQLEPSGRGTRLTVAEQGAFLDGYDDAGSRERGTAQLLDALGASLRA